MCLLKCLRANFGCIETFKLLFEALRYIYIVKDKNLIIIIITGGSQILSNDFKICFKV